MNANRAFIFTAGAIVGASTAWFCLKKYYADIAQEEINSVKETYARANKADKNEPVQPEEDNAELKKELFNIINTHYAQVDSGDSAYTDYSSAAISKEQFDPDISAAPYVIPPDECGEEPEYEIAELTYFINDDILVDGFGEVVDNPDALVGRDFKNHFGEYEDDSVFIRNERLKCDFEILKDFDNYTSNY